MIKKVPIPICGVALGCAALGNLLQSYSEGIRMAFGLLSLIFMVLFILKVIMFPSMVKEDMKNPVMASVSGTFSMCLMLLAGYVKPYIGQAESLIWYLAIALHVALILYFTKTFVLGFALSKVFASWYIVYVGIVVASVTAPAFNATGLGGILFWFGLVCFVILFFVVTKRYMTLQKLPDMVKPLIVIYAAPMSLCIAGYVQSVTPKSRGFLLGMLEHLFYL